MPLTEHETTGMFREWQQLGYDTRGFDLEVPAEYLALPSDQHSMTREEWPNFEEMRNEGAQRSYQVKLPNLQGMMNMLFRDRNHTYIHFSMERLCQRTERG